MTPLNLLVTNSLISALHAARDGEPLGPFIESRLWSDRKIAAAAKAQGIKQEPRTKRGRPRRKAD